MCAEPSPGSSAHPYLYLHTCCYLRTAQMSVQIEGPMAMYRVTVPTDLCVQISRCVSVAPTDSSSTGTHMWLAVCPHVPTCALQMALHRALGDSSHYRDPAGATPSPPCTHPHSRTPMITPSPAACTPSRLPLILLKGFIKPQRTETRTHGARRERGGAAYSCCQPLARGHRRGPVGVTTLTASPSQPLPPARIASTHVPHARCDQIPDLAVALGAVPGIPTTHTNAPARNRQVGLWQ